METNPVHDSTLIIAMKYFILAQAPATPSAPKGIGEMFQGMLPMMIAFFAIMYFLMIRPNQQREKARRNMLASLSKGDKVITQGGVLGTIVGVSEKSVVLRVSDDPPVKMEFMIGAISKVDDSDKKKKD